MRQKIYVGPISIIRGKNAKDHLKFASSVTLRYSDAPKNESGIVLIKSENNSEEITTKVL